MIYNSLYLNDYNIDKISYQQYLVKNSGESKKSSNLNYILETFVPKRARACLILHYYKDKSMTDIAKIFGVSNATVSRDIKKAKAILEREFNF